MRRWTLKLLEWSGLWNTRCVLFGTLVPFMAPSCLCHWKLCASRSKKNLFLPSYMATLPGPTRDGSPVNSPSRFLQVVPRPMCNHHAANPRLRLCEHALRPCLRIFASLNLTTVQNRGLNTNPALQPHSGQQVVCLLPTSHVSLTIRKELCPSQNNM